MGVPHAMSLRKTLRMLTMTGTKLFLWCCSARESSATQLEHYGRGREQTYLRYMLHFTFAYTNFQVPPFLQQPCWAQPKVQLPNGGTSLWATSAGSIHHLRMLHGGTWHPTGVSDALQVLVYHIIRSISQKGLDTYLGNTHWWSYSNKLEEITIIP